MVDIARELPLMSNVKLGIVGCGTVADTISRRLWQRLVST